MNHIKILGNCSNRWANSTETDLITLLEKHIASRGLNLLLVPASLVISALETVVGLGCSVAAALYPLKDRAILLTAANAGLESSTLLLANPYKFLLQTINPQAITQPSQKAPVLMPESLNNCPLLATDTEYRLLTNKVITQLEDIAQGFCNADNFFEQQLLSRFTYVAMAIVLIANRVIDLLAGIPLGILSLLMLGKITWLNNLAFRGLCAPKIVHELFLITIKMFDPGFRASIK